MKERLTITVDKELLDKVDKIVDGVNIRNRSHAIEYLIRSALSESFVFPFLYDVIDFSRILL